MCKHTCTETRTHTHAQSFLTATGTWRFISVFSISDLHKHLEGNRMGNMKSRAPVKSMAKLPLTSAILILPLNLKSMRLFVYFLVQILSSNNINTEKITACQQSSTEIGRFFFEGVYASFEFSLIRVDSSHSIWTQIKTEISNSAHRTLMYSIWIGLRSFCLHFHALRFITSFRTRNLQQNPAEATSFHLVSWHNYLTSGTTCMSECIPKVITQWYVG